MVNSRIRFPRQAFLVGAAVLGLAVCLLSATAAETPKDLKGEILVIVLEPDGSSREQAALRDAFKAAAEKQGASDNLWIVETDSLKSTADRLQEWPAQTRERIGAILMVKVPREPVSTARASAAVFHYPFGEIAREHVSSPEYSFKFASDSALYAIHLDRATSSVLSRMARESGPNSLQIRFAEPDRYSLSPDLLGRTVWLTLEGVADPAQQAESILNAFDAFRKDSGNAVMGIVSDKVRRKIESGNAEIRIFNSPYNNKEEWTEEEKAERRRMGEEPVAIVRPGPFAQGEASGIYYVTDLDPLAAYAYTVIDTSKDPDDFWYEVDSGSFVTSSITGVVRTVPVKTEEYTPIASEPQNAALSIPTFEILDWVIEGATVFDGTRDTPARVSDVGLVGEKIAAVGNLKDTPRKMTVNGSGLFLMPGFIDIHSHADSDLPDVPYAPSHVRQGITTVLGGNCSFSDLGIGAYLAEREDLGTPINIGLLIGNRPVRQRVLGRRKGMFSYNDLYKEKELVDLAMEEGAFGMATGLIYSISEEAFAWELAEMAKQMKPYGGFYASHIRGETDEVIDAAREAIHIGELAEVPVQISHMKVLQKRNWGDMERYLDVIKDARARGLDVTGDQYPWRASGPAAHYTLYRLMVREAIRNESPDVVLLKDMPAPFAKYSGRPLPELLEGENLTPEQLIQELNLTEDSKIYATFLCLSEDDVKLPMKEDFVMVCTDSGVVSLDAIQSGRVWDEHPRKFRSYPEFFARYVRDKGVCAWELAVYKCTGLPAWRMGLADRGIIRPGAFADLVLMNPKTVDPVVDYRDQAPPPAGIDWVFINGVPVVKEGELTKERSGKPLFAGGRHKP